MCMSCAASADVLVGGGIVGAASLRVGARMLVARRRSGGSAGVDATGTAAAEETLTASVADDPPS